MVIVRQNPFQLGVVANARSGKVGFLSGDDRHKVPLLSLLFSSGPGIRPGMDFNVSTWSPITSPVLTNCGTNTSVRSSFAVLKLLSACWCVGCAY